MPYIKGKMVPWKPEDYIDHGIKPNVYSRSCDLCKRAEQKIDNICAGCIMSGWKAKKRFIKATKSKATRSVIPGHELVGNVEALQDDPGAMIEYLQARKIPELARLAKLVHVTVPFGSTKDTFINEIVGGVI